MLRGHIILIILAVLLTGYGIIGITAPAGADRIAPNTAQLHVNEYTLSLDIADEWAERVRGLSGRENLPEDTGLLLVFKESGYHGIWMKDMNFPIDIIWLSETIGGDGAVVVDIRRDVHPDTYPTTFHPQKPASFVLETASGVSEKLDLEVGDVLDMSFGDGIEPK